MKNIMGFDPTKKYTPVTVDPVDNKSLFGTDTYDIVVDIDLLRYIDYTVVMSIYEECKDSPDFDFSKLEDMDDEARFMMIYYREHKNPLYDFMVNKDLDLDDIWNTYRKSNKDRITKYSETDLFFSVLNTTIDKSVGSIYIISDEPENLARRIEIDEIVNKIYFRVDKIKFLYSDKTIDGIYEEYKSLLNKARIFIWDDIRGLKKMIDSAPNSKFAGCSFLIPNRRWNTYKQYAAGFGDLHRIAENFDEYSLAKMLDVRVVDILPISGQDLVVG